MIPRFSRKNYLRVVKFNSEKPYKLYLPWHLTGYVYDIRSRVKWREGWFDFLINSTQNSREELLTLCLKKSCQRKLLKKLPTYHCFLEEWQKAQHAIYATYNTRSSRWQQVDDSGREDEGVTRQSLVKRIEKKLFPFLVFLC